MLKKIKTALVGVASLASVFFFYWKGYQKGSIKASQRVQKEHQHLIQKIAKKEEEKLDVNKDNVVNKLNTRFNNK